MKERLVQGAARVREMRAERNDVSRLAARVTELEAEVQECRQLNLRLAELTDVVQELLLPVAQRDNDRIAELMERYTDRLS
ncbi:DUF6752 domain-containing protein [Nocardioides speluncae]|uniref:DUF6752 domain-containing protein n=1 Tax=Nocardioides speluncae TaxID=2670337 RepID=UPI001F0B928E|nr:DUF6752 domain-containing protein [Nocardioides speluncae]